MSSDKSKNPNINRRKKDLSTTDDSINDEMNDEIRENTETTEMKPIWKRVLQKSILSFSILVVVYYSTKSNQNNDIVMVSVKQKISGSPLGQEITCSDDYDKDRLKFRNCAPKRCGRFVSDAVVAEDEATHLLSLAKRALSLGGSSGGASILDLHSGALSHQTNFVNVYKLIENDPNKNVFSVKDFKIYKEVKNKILHTIALHFGISAQHLFLTHPTFFSRITSDSAKTVHDEYWHRHVDKETYKSFHFTSLLYLSNYNHDFTGGRFVFIDKTINKNITIEPRIARLSAFTSGSENEHFVEKVMSGTRYAITVSFTCDPNYAISDPSIQSTFRKQNES